MRVSVLIPTYNRAEYLGEAIESVLAQTYRDFEIVVVDDGSTDHTSELVKRYPSARYVYQDHAGIPRARNRALAEAKGELIAWLDSDDLYAPKKLEKQVQYILDHPDCSIVFCFPESFSNIEYPEMTAYQRRLVDAYGKNYCTCLPSALMRRDLFQRNGQFNEAYACGEDTEWIARIAAGGVSVKHCLRERLYLVRIHDRQITYAINDHDRKDRLSIYADAIRGAMRRKRGC